MKLSIFALLFVTVSFAQVGIGTTDPKGALDITATNEGLLIPRIALTATNVPTILTPTVSELVYNTATAGTSPNNVEPGYYYWNGSAWNKLAITTNAGWSVAGNVGTDPNINFIGTTDAKDMVFRANNTERMRIVSASGDLKIGNTTSGTIRSTKELVLRQDGDDFGSSVLRLRNRNAENGAIFENLNPLSGANLVDFIFKTGTTTSPISSNIRFETRTGGTSIKIPGNTSEWQFGQPDNLNGGPTLVLGANGTKGLGSNSAFLIGKVGIGTVNLTSKLKIDATQETIPIPSIEIVPIRNIPPGTASGQIIFFNNSLYIYDLIRAKWLSSETMTYTFGKNNGANNEYLSYGGVVNNNNNNTLNNTAGAKMLRNATIIGITAQANSGQGGSDKILHITNGPNQAPISSPFFTFALNSHSYLDNLINLDVNQGDVLNIFVTNNGQAVNNLSVTLHLKWRQ